MEKIDWSPLKETVDGLALQLLLILCIPLAVSLLLKILLIRLIKVPNSISNFVSVVIFLFLVYKMFEILFGYK